MDYPFLDTGAFIIIIIVRVIICSSEYSHMDLYNVFVMYKLRFCTSCYSYKEPVQVATCNFIYALIVE